MWCGSGEKKKTHGHALHARGSGSEHRQHVFACLHACHVLPRVAGEVEFQRSSGAAPTRTSRRCMSVHRPPPRRTLQNPPLGPSNNVDAMQRLSPPTPMPCQNASEDSLGMYLLYYSHPMHVNVVVTPTALDYDYCGHSIISKWCTRCTALLV